MCVCAASRRKSLAKVLHARQQLLPSLLWCIVILGHESPRVHVAVLPKALSDQASIMQRYKALSCLMRVLLTRSHWLACAVLPLLLLPGYAQLPRGVCGDRHAG